MVSRGVNDRYIRCSNQLFYQLFAALFFGVWGAPIRRMPTGLKELLDFVGRMWTAALRPDPLSKRPCAVLFRLWDGEQIKLAVVTIVSRGVFKRHAE